MSSPPIRPKFGSALDKPCAWKNPVSVCIALACEGDDRGMGIVMCSDKRATIPELGSSDTAYKLYFIRPGMACMASDDTSLASELISIYRRHLADKQDSKIDLLSELRVPPRILRRRLVEEYLETNWSMSRDEYLAGAAKVLPDKDQMQIASDIQGVSLNIGLVIGAFNRDDQARIFTVNDKGAVRESENFGVIGSGSWQAVSSLYQRQYSGAEGIDEAFYYAYEAKKRSEIEVHVGPDTVIGYLAPRAETCDLVTYMGIEFLEERYRSMQKLEEFSIENLHLITLPPEAVG